MSISISCMIVLVFAAPDMALRHAGLFLEAGFYEEAITEYKRYVYFNPSDELASDAYYKMARAYTDQNRWDDAIFALRQSIHTSICDSVKQEREIALAATYIAGRRYSLGEILLLKILTYTDYPYLKQKALVLHGVACLYSAKWEAAQSSFDAYFQEQPEPALQADIDTLLREARNFFYKSPDDARGLSTLIPGLGQFYVGDYKNALNAFLLNGGLAAWMIYKLWHGYLGDVYVIYYFLFRRYYYGNRYHAQRLAHEYNENLDAIQVEKILHKIIEE
jgi:hypothetical protein